MEHAEDCGPVLFLWQSECAVVMGKNQNPWRECRLGLMRDEGVPLARRISGGGTVYHDVGNLNYCVIVDRTRYKEDAAYEVVLQALASFDINAEKTGKSNLSVAGRKFSGNAFSFRKSRALHHGTLLLHTDLERLNRYLGSMVERIDTHAIASVPAEVMNLELDVLELGEVIKEKFRALYGESIGAPIAEHKIDEAMLQSFVERQVSDEWQYGATPRFSVDLNGLKVEVVKGRAVDTKYAGGLFKDLAISLFC